MGYGVCRFGAEFGFQDHPNVEVVAVSDLEPDRCAALAKACRCARTYPSLEELVKDDRIEAVFLATDAPSHARHCMEVLRHGKHVACAVPAVFGSLEEADQLYQAVRRSGRKYMMFETSCFHEVSCLGYPSVIPHLQSANNRYRNSFGTEIALFRTSDGGSARMAVSWDTPGDQGERGRIRAQRGSFHKTFQGLETQLPSTARPPLPPGVEAGRHGGSHGHLTHEFVLSILQDRQPLVEIAMALNLTVSGSVAHTSASKDGEWLKIPQYRS